MRLKYLLPILCFFYASPAFAQVRNCSTMEVHKLLYGSNPKYREAYDRNHQKLYFPTYVSRISAADSVITIPVIVHVLWNATEENITDEQVKSQLDVLNEDFGAFNSNIADVPGVWQPLVKDSKIRFVLARKDPSGNPSSGIIRVNTPVSAFGINDPLIFSSADGGSDAWPRASYLNFWVCNLADNVLGFASFPSSSNSEDGVVINYRAFGRIGPETKKPYNLGRTTTHEVGHWLGLVHIWGDDAGACSNDDNIQDTPLQANSNTRCPSFPKTDNCSPVSPGIMFMNYMDYTDDKCMSFFTPGQSSVMYTTLKTIRDSIQFSDGSNYPQLIGLEAGIDSVLAPRIFATEQCFKPKLRIRNYGTENIYSMKFVYRLNEGLTKSVTVEDTIPAGTSKIVELADFSSPPEDRILEIRMLLNDSVKTDNYVSISLRTTSSAVQNCVVKMPVIFPNPVGASSLACLKTNYAESRDVKLRVYDMQGRVVISRDLQVNAGDALAMDMRPLQGGIYIAELRSDQSVDTVKFMYQPDSNASGYYYSCN